MDSYTFSGRSLVPLSKKLNPRWWFQNDAEQTVDQAPWFEPDKPQAQREADWNNRNPAQNLRAYVLGVQDRNYTVVGKAPVLTVQRNDLQPPERGFQYCLLKLPIPLPFISYSGRYVTWYFGWQPTGFFGAKFNIHANAG
jgi:hypothetical protein